MMMTPEQELFTLALGLTAPWQVEEVVLDAEKGRLDIRISYERGSSFPCPKCGVKRKVHDSKDKTWRHLDFFQHECYLSAKTPRTKCEACGVQLVDVPWARRRSGFTLLYEAFAMKLAKDMPINAVARTIRTSDKKVWRIFNHYISKEREKQDYSGVTQIGIDETSSRKRHKYVTFFVDLVKRCVLYGTSGKDAQTVGRFVSDLKAHKGNPQNITTVCADLSPAFTSGVKKHLQKAALTYDRFHIKKLVNEAMDDVRRAEVSKNAEYKKTRYALLKNPQNLTEKERKKLETITKDNSEIARAYNLKTTFDDLFLLKTKEDGKAFLKKWCGWAQRSKLKPFVKVKKTIEKHANEILNWFDSRVSNGILEGINGLVQQAKNRARGFRNDTNLINMTYLIAGKW
jgi:transposase